jgi:beta-lactamase superfamily II metal-dependent hydrolase
MAFGDMDNDKELLKEAGYKGEEIGLLYSTTSAKTTTFATTVQGFLTAAGINVKMDGVDTATAYSRAAAYDYDLCYTEYTVSQMRAMKLCDEKGIEVIDVTDGDTIPFGDVDIRCMQFKGHKAVNNLSGVLRVQYGDCTLLLTGDIDGSAQRDLAKRYDLHCDIVKVPHHGITSLEWAFMKDITPEYMFIPHGAGDTAKDQQVLNKYKIPYGFASWGMIKLTTDGTRWLVEQHVDDPKLQKDKRLKFY